MQSSIPSRSAILVAGFTVCSDSDQGDVAAKDEEGHATAQQHTHAPSVEATSSNSQIPSV
jgi:uncharacterized protein YjdB